uniref:Protein neuralized-like n=1 Tax=Dermatophagoides pteronyssinus TaxID=6956 RepID=A0A6P6YDE4_DERPT|nr:protein neuralized-like [Dermatophagoides pteronyssinus]
MKLLKKIRRIASQKNLSFGQNGQNLATNNLSPIGFHSVHGENIRINGNGMIAERIGSYCRGICFSNRPIRFNERICIRIVEMSDFWSGVLRFGFTTKDPTTLRNSLPKYVCPNLTNCGHTFAKALPERYSHKNCILSFYLSTNGNIHYSINNVDKGIILENVKINGGPFWAVIDLYGNTQKIELIDPRYQPNNSRNKNMYIEPERLYTSVSMMDLPNEMSHEPLPQIYSNKFLEQSIQFHRTRGCNVRLSSNKCVAERNSNHYSQGYVFTNRPLAIGEKIVLQILRTDEMFTGSLTFGLTSCNPNFLNVADFPEDSHHLLDRPEYWTVIKDVANSPMAGDEIAFTITESGEVIMTKNRQRSITLMHVDISQNLWGFFDLYGSTLKVRLLGSQTMNHHKSHLNLANHHHSIQSNRPLTNAISMHNVYKSSQMEYSPALNPDHHHHYNQHQSYQPKKKSTIMTTQQPNWPYVAYPTIQRQNKANANKKAFEHNYNYNNDYHHVDGKLYNQISNNLTNSTSLSSTSSTTATTFGNECVVCYEEPINSVFYTCGHVCMCYKCSVKQWQTSGHCPICRAKIVDVIRTYWS